jgi:hypothetical protein
VDDSPYNIFVLKELIRSHNSAIDIMTALNGEEAIEKIMDNLTISNLC